MADSSRDRSRINLPKRWKSVISQFLPAAAVSVASLPGRTCTPRASKAEWPGLAASTHHLTLTESTLYPSSMSSAKWLRLEGDNQPLTVSGRLGSSLLYAVSLLIFRQVSPGYLAHLGNHASTRKEKEQVKSRPVSSPVCYPRMMGKLLGKKFVPKKKMGRNRILSYMSPARFPVVGMAVPTSISQPAPPSTYQNRSERGRLLGSNTEVALHTRPPSRVCGLSCSCLHP